MPTRDGALLALLMVGILPLLLLANRHRDHGPKEAQIVKRGKKFLLLLAVLVVAVGGWLLVSNLTGDESEKEEAGSTLVQVAGDDIQSLQWVSGGEEIAFARSDNGWEYSADPSFPTDQSRLQTLVDDVAAITSTKTIAGVADFSQYGLDDPSLTLTVTYKDGGQNVYELGNQNAITDNYYLRMDGGSDVQLVDKTLHDSFAVSLYSLAVTESVPSMDTPVGLLLDTGTEPLDIEYLEDSSGLTYSDEFHWFQDQNGSYRTVDTYNVLTFVSSLGGLEWQSLVNYHADAAALAEYGLDDPAAVLTVRYTESGDTAEKTFTLELGDFDASGSCYARIAGSEMVYLIDGETRRQDPPFQLRRYHSDEVCYMNVDELRGVDVIRDGVAHHIDIDRSGTSVVYTLDGKELSADDTAALLQSLRNLRSSGNVAEDSSTDREEAIGFTFYRDAGKYSVMTARFYSYDSGSYLVGFNDARTQLVSRADLDKIIDAAEGLLAS